MIVKAGIEHAGILSDVGAETFVDAHKDSAPAHEIDRYILEKYNVATIKQALSDPKNIYHILEYDNQVAGYSKMMLSCHHPAVSLPNVSKIDQIYLRESYHGLKLGAELLQFNMALSKEYMQAGMWLVVWEGNHKAMAFYKRFGFETISGGDFHLTNTHTSRYHLMLLTY